MQTEIIRLTQDALWLVLALSAPLILVATVFGLLIAIIQAATQLQEQTVAFAVKLVAVSVTLLLTSGLIGQSLYQFTLRIFHHFPFMSGH
jgi:type III secretion protein S